MNIEISPKINYELEATRLIDLHYHEKGCRGWLEKTLEKSSYNTDYSSLLEPLIAIEEDVFSQVSIREEDLDLYFKGSFDGPEDTAAISIAETFCEVDYFVPEPDETEQKKYFSLLLFADAIDTPDYTAPDRETFYRLLCQASMPLEKKWRCLTVYNDFGTHRSHFKTLLAPIVTLLKKHEPQLLALLNQYACSPDTLPYLLQDEHRFCKLDISHICLDYYIFGFNRMVMRVLELSDEACYLHYGLYVDYFFKEKQRLENASAQIAAKWKNLSDKSRLKILCLLKEREMFGQELKDALGLSNATISHHMNELLVDNFVSLRKEGTKIIYQLNQKSIKEAIDEMSRLLLD